MAHTQILRVRPAESVAEMIPERVTLTLSDSTRLGCVIIATHSGGELARILHDGDGTELACQGKASSRPGRK